MSNAKSKTNQELLNRYLELPDLIADNYSKKRQFEKLLVELKLSHEKALKDKKEIEKIIADIQPWPILGIVSDAMNRKILNVGFIEKIKQQLQQNNLKPDPLFIKDIEELVQCISQIVANKGGLFSRLKAQKNKQLILINKIKQSSEYNTIISKLDKKLNDVTSNIDVCTKEVENKGQEIQKLQDLIATQGTELVNLKANGVLKAYLEQTKNEVIIKINAFKKLDKNTLPIVFWHQVNALISSFEAKSKDFKSDIVEENKDLPELLSNVEALLSLANLKIDIRIKNLRTELQKLPEKGGDYNLHKIINALLDKQEVLFIKLTFQKKNEVIKIDNQLKLFETLLTLKDNINNIFIKMDNLNSLIKKLPAAAQDSYKSFITNCTNTITALLSDVPENNLINLMVYNTINQLTKNIREAYSNAELVQKKVELVDNLRVSLEINKLPEPIKNNIKQVLQQAQEVLDTVTFTKGDILNKLETVEKNINEAKRLEALVPNVKRLLEKLSDLQQEIKALPSTKETTIIITSAKFLLNDSYNKLKNLSEVTNENIESRATRVHKTTTSIRKLHRLLESYNKLAIESKNLNHFTKTIEEKLNSVAILFNSLNINNDSFDNYTNEIEKTLRIISQLGHENTQAFADNLVKLNRLNSKHPSEKVLIGYWEEKLLSAPIKTDNTKYITDDLLEEIKQTVALRTTLIDEEKKLGAAANENKIIQDSIDKIKNSANKTKRCLQDKMLFAVSENLVQLRQLMEEMNDKIIKTLKPRQYILVSRIKSLKEFKSELNTLSEDEIIGKAISLGLQWPITTVLPEQDFTKLKLLLAPCIDKTLQELTSFKKQGDDNLKIIKSIKKHISEIEKDSAMAMHIEKAVKNTNDNIQNAILKLNNDLTSLKTSIETYLKGCNILSRTFGATAKNLKKTQSKILEALKDVDNINESATKILFSSDSKKDARDLFAEYKYTKKCINNFAENKTKDIDKMKEVVEKLIPKK